MKKIALIILVCSYSLSSLGIGIKQFYCCGKLKYTHLGIIQNFNDSCKNCSQKDNGCCKTKFKSLKVNDTHIAADGMSFPVKYFFAIPFQLQAQEIMSLKTRAAEILYAGNAPPTLHGVSFCIFFSVFRI